MVNIILFIKTYNQSIHFLTPDRNAVKRCLMLPLFVMQNNDIEMEVESDFLFVATTIKLLGDSRFKSTL